MIVDASAALAILLSEPDAPTFARALAEADGASMSAVNFVEAAIALESQTGTAGELDALMRRAAIKLAPVSAEQAYLARQAYADFGKGRHAARLNLGDCFAYALAKFSGEALLFKGEDFRRTDVIAAV